MAICPQPWKELSRAVEWDHRCSLGSGGLQIPTHSFPSFSGIAGLLWCRNKDRHLSWAFSLPLLVAAPAALTGLLCAEVYNFGLSCISAISRH